MDTGGVDCDDVGDIGRDVGCDIGCNMDGAIGGVFEHIKAGGSANGDGGRGEKGEWDPLTTRFEGGVS